eukprot:TRINITY_DN8145_c0_g1_i4.p1 TRINITY_DN8145_c0_g1~~TRINITY_DN8145_c0_g1_i4.p1  ORF type:complete len:449 (+),score=86.26 TRINITY_DN8145_c0_g1_i4:31-1377(+)
MAATCRFCFEEENLIAACACRGSSGYVHQACLLEWCESKGDFKTCDLCHQRFIGPAALALARHSFRLADRLGEEHPEATELLRFLLPIYERKKGQQHLNTLAVRSLLALALGKLGQREEAVCLQRETLARLRRWHGEDHAHTVTEMNNLANEYSASGKDAEALELLQKVLEVRTRSTRSDHPSALQAANGLAGALSRVGKHEEALKLLKRTCQSSLRVLGEDHPFSLTVRTNLLVIHFQLGPSADAIQEQKDLLDLHKRVFGQEDPRTLKVAALSPPPAAAPAAAAPSARASSSAAQDAASGTSPGAPCYSRALGKPACAFGVSCYRKNPTHFIEEDHPADHPLIRGAADAATAAPEESCLSGSHPPGPKRKRTRENEYDEVLALLLELGVPLERSSRYLEAFVLQGFDCRAAFQTLTESDLDSFGLAPEDRRRVSEHLASSGPRTGG